MGNQAPRMLFAFLLYFLLHHAACRILVPQPEMEPTSPAVEAWHLNHWTTGEVPICIFCLFFFFWCQKLSELFVVVNDGKKSVTCENSAKCKHRRK